jgi:hypothetical protein
LHPDLVLLSMVFRAQAYRKGIMRFKPRAGVGGRADVRELDRPTVAPRHNASMPPDKFAMAGPFALCDALDTGAGRAAALDHAVGSL